jgi:hypothetical protein
MPVYLGHKKSASAGHGGLALSAEGKQLRLGGRELLTGRRYSTRCVGHEGLQ